MLSINIVGPVNDLSYGNVTYEITRALQAKGVRVALFPITGQIKRDPTQIIPSLNNRQFPDFNAPCIRIWHQNDMSEFVGNGPKIGFPIFELDTFTGQELYHLQSVDYIYVCSEWAKSVLIENGFNGEKIFVVPLGVDREVFFHTPMPQTKKTIFFTIGKWEVRKGHDILIKAFKEAFTEEDDVVLLMCCSNPFNTPEENAYWENLAKHPKIRIVPHLQTQEQVADLIRAGHCGVFPTRAEGFGLPLLETLSCGRHLITTAYSAHKEFSDTGYTMYINSGHDIELEKAVDNKWFHGQGNWLKITDQAIGNLRNMMWDYHKTWRTPSGDKDIMVAGVTQASNYTWTNTAERLIDATDVICKLRENR